MINLTTKHGQHALDRLQSEIAVWLTTIDDHGIPQPNPVWFLWQEDKLLIYSMPSAKRLRYIVDRPQVSLNFDADKIGEDVVVITGEATLAPDAPKAHEVSAYVQKYDQWITRIQMNPKSFSDLYSVAFYVYPKTLRGF